MGFAEVSCKRSKKFLASVQINISWSLDIAILFTEPDCLKKRKKCRAFLFKLNSICVLVLHNYRLCNHKQDLPLNYKQHKILLPFSEFILRKISNMSHLSFVVDWFEIYKWFFVLNQIKLRSTSFPQNSSWPSSKSKQPSAWCRHTLK